MKNARINRVENFPNLGIRPTQKRPVNQLRCENFPKLMDGQKWVIQSYLQGKATRSCPKKLEDFSELVFLGRSGKYYHILADGKKILICSILIK